MTRTERQQVANQYLRYGAGLASLDTSVQDLGRTQYAEGRNTSYWTAKLAFGRSSQSYLLDYQIDKETGKVLSTDTLRRA